MNVKKLTTMAMLTAISMIVFLIEAQIPLPIAIMCLLKPFISRKHIWVMSIFGALGHNAGQLAVAVFVSGTPSIAFYAPVLILAGIITGFFTGQCAQLVLNHMDKLKGKG